MLFTTRPSSLLKALIFLSLHLLSLNALAFKGTLNIHAWGGEIPPVLIKQFEKKYQIKINLTTFDSNEGLYAKLDSSNDYDVITPSAYMVDKLQKENRLLKLTKQKLPNLKNIDSIFLTAKNANNTFSAPYLWGTTGIFYNSKKYQLKNNSWNALWDKQFRGKLLVLDDAKEVFSIALLSLGYSANDKSPAHLEKAYQKLLKLLPNIKLFSTNTVPSLIIDEEVFAGTAWNGDVFKAKKELSTLHYIYPKEGFIIGIDCLAVLKNAPHKPAAIKFINFMLDAENGKITSVYSGFSTTNQASFKRLPKEYRDNKLLYPSKEILKKGSIQQDIGDKAYRLMIQYWQQLKLAI